MFKLGKNKWLRIAVSFLAGILEIIKDEFIRQKQKPRERYRDDPYDQFR